MLHFIRREIMVRSTELTVVEEGAPGLKLLLAIREKDIIDGTECHW
jgi:hypothetical protein